MIIEIWACPACEMPRTVRTRDQRRICFNCRRVWRRARRPEPVAARAHDDAFPFSAGERARLLVYRAAVQAGFFNDGVPSPAAPQR
jgi:hypothetical protein